MRARRLNRDQRGASAVEFALLSPVLFAFIFFIIEGGRMVWTQQAIQEVAASAARCMAIGTSPCEKGTDTNQYRSNVRTFARNRARDWGVTIAMNTVDPRPDQSCDGVTGMSWVRITLPYHTIVGHLLPQGPTNLTATACFPTLG